MPVVPFEYTFSQRIIAAGTRLRDAWDHDPLDVTEMHDAALGLLWVTETKDLQSALDVLHNIESP